jgi:hypothetical protein
MSPTAPTRRMPPWTGTGLAATLAVAAELLPGCRPVTAHAPSATDETTADSVPNRNSRRVVVMRAPAYSPQQRTRVDVRSSLLQRARTDH